MEDVKKCPYCGEEVLATAKKCKHCSEWLDPMKSETVKADNSAKLDNLYQLARRAQKEGNFEKSAQHYETILLEVPNCWESVFYSSYCNAVSQYQNDKTGSAIKTLLSCTNSALDLIEDNKGEDEQQSKLAVMIDELSQICEEIYNELYEEKNGVADNLKNIPRSEYLEFFDQYDKRIIAISKIYALLGFKILELFNDNSDFGKKGISMVEKGIRVVKDGVTYFLAKSERKGIISEYQECMASIRKQTSERRFNEYWEAHQSERENLESEKQSLNEQINTLNNKISEIPQNTDGYTLMVELQKKVQDLTVEKKALGFFKFKDKKAIRMQINAVKAEIAPIQLRIDSAIDDVKKDISLLQSRIKEIDIELTKPR